MLKSACWLELPLAGIHLFSPILYNTPFPVLRSFFGVSQRIAGERKELFAKIQKELFQQTIAVRGRPGFYGSTRLPSWPKTCFRDPGCAPRVNFPAYRVKFRVLNFGQFGQNSPYTLIRTHWRRSRSPFHDSRLRFRTIGEFRRTRRIISSTPLRVLRCTRNPCITLITMHVLMCIWY